MGDSISSTVRFKSNLQPVIGSYREDRHFLSSIHDPFALEAMGKAGYDTITPIQKREYRDASLHCSYAFEGDYPWGTIVGPDGKQCVVCKCTNTDCHHFSSCRPDFDPAELMAEGENAQFQSKVQELLFAIAEEKAGTMQSLQQGDALAAATLLKGNVVKPEDHEAPVSTENYEKPATVVLPKPEKSEIESAVREAIPPVQTATFESFVEVEQTDIIEMNPEERTVVNAGPGTGKTWTLIEKIKYMLSAEEVDPANILVLCFSRAAVEVIRNRLEQAAERDELPLNWHQVDVRTFDSFATYMLAWLQENKPEILPRNFSLEFANYDQRIQTAVSAIMKFTDLLADYEHVIIDEVQDLVGVRAEMVLALLKNLPESCGFTILGDSCQSLYDYLAKHDSSIMDSGRFYQTIFCTFGSANYCALTHNYRQGDEFGKLTAPYRTAILTGDAEARTAEAKKLSAALTTSKVDLRRFSSADATRFKKTGTLGILTRTNGQALQISSWLRAQGINHTLQKSSGSQELASWIGRVLMNAETDVIDRKEFSALFGAAYPMKVNMTDQYWNALISTQRDQTKRHYEIEDFLRGLMQNARDPLLFEDPIGGNVNITVSNIHRAKGREFDSVLVLGDVLDALSDEEIDDVLEHKVCYVALTRPKKAVEKVELKPQYIFISKDESRRCFRAGGFKDKRYLSHFEIGDSFDINSRSLAESIATQTYIQKLTPGTRLKLLKCPEGTKTYIAYRVVPEEDEHTILGYTTPAFARSMERAIQRIYGNGRSIAYKYYPNIFGDVYLDGLNTCVSASGTGITGAKQMGSMYIWYGISVSGFAQMEKDRY